MAMFHHEEDAQAKDVETVIGASVKVEGTFVGAGDIVVDGQVTGTLKTNKNLRIGQRAVLKADIEGANIVVAGEIRGQIKCGGKIELLPTAKIYGNIDTQTIAVAHGAVLHGKVSMSGHEVAPEAMVKEKNGRG
jgi:cytoskeletal protein CcmA (bactofilin family)